MSQLPPRSHYTWRTWFTFLVPSLIGVFLFMTPITTSAEMKVALSETFSSIFFKEIVIDISVGMTIPIAVMAKIVQGVMAESIQTFITVIICITGVVAFAICYVIELNLP